MPKRIPLQTVVLWRDGQQVVPPINRAFDFTKEELETIEKLNPSAIGKIVNGDANDTLVTKTQAEIDADQQKAIDDAIAAFKKEQGIKDDSTQSGTGAGSTGDSKASTAGTSKSDKGTGAKPGDKSGKQSDSDDDI